MMEITAESKDVLWSEHPQNAYVTDYKGYQMGIGAHPGVRANKGIWNLVWLLTPAEVMDAFLKTTSNDKLVMTTSDFPYLIGTAWQMLSSTTLVATAALKLTPLDFLSAVAGGGHFNDLILTKYNPDWVADCMPKALTFSQRHLSNVVRVNFGGLKSEE